MTRTATRLSRCIFVSTVATLLAAPLIGGVAWAAEEPSWEKTTHQWFEELPKGGTVHVDNPWGRVYARFGGYEPRIEIVGTEQRLDVDTPPLTVERTKVDDGLRVLVRPDNSPAGTHVPRGDDRRDRIDLVVFLPEGIALDVRTDDDDVEIKGIHSDVNVSTLQGDVRVTESDGCINVKSVRGDIYVAFEDGATKKPQELTTETGDIEAQLWEDASMEVDIATSGEISTDWSMKIEHRRFEEPGKFARATVGGGGPRLSLYSKRGKVSLFRMQKFFSPDASR